MDEIKHLDPLSKECNGNVDGDACNPCGKFYDSLFTKYENYVEQSLIKILEFITRMEQESMQ